MTGELGTAHKIGPHAREAGGKIGQEAREVGAGVARRGQGGRRSRPGVGRGQAIIHRTAVGVRTLRLDHSDGHSCTTPPGAVRIVR